jgi:hypothetical protein
MDGDSLNRPTRRESPTVSSNHLTLDINCNVGDRGAAAEPDNAEHAVARDGCAAVIDAGSVAVWDHALPGSASTAAGKALPTPPLSRRLYRFAGVCLHDPRRALRRTRQLLFPPGTKREHVYVSHVRPLIFGSNGHPPEAAVGVADATDAAASAAPPPLSLQTAGLSLGPLKFIPHDGGFFSNFNFLIGEMYLGRVVYPVFTRREASRHSGTLRHFCYADDSDDNAWFQFFQPISYFDGDTRHLDADFLDALEETAGDLAPPEFRLPAITLALYSRPDFADWRAAMHRVIGNRIRLADDLRRDVDRMLARMPGHRIGVHVRHPSHMVEQGRVLFCDYFSVIDGLLLTHPGAAIFLATDNELAIATFRHRYGEQVLCHAGFLRGSIDDVVSWAYSLITGEPDEMGFVSGTGFQVHYKLAAAGGGADGLRSGKEAAIDAFTLAACDEFVCTASNFTLACAFLNPAQRQHLVSKGAA